MTNKNPQRWRLPPAWWGVLPSLLVLGIFVVYPLIQVVGFSTQEWDGVAPSRSIGFENYINLLQDPDLWRSLGTTAVFAAATLPLFVLLSALTALELEGTRLERPLKALLFLPGIWTVGASAIGWFTLYGSEYGMIATVLDQLSGGTVKFPLPWENQAWAAIIMVVLFTIWQHLGYGVLIVSAGLKSIPAEVMEAARVDGASENQVRWQVVLPILRPNLVFLSVIGSLYALESYTAVFLLTRGGPVGGTKVVGYFLYETAFEKFKFGYASALSMLILVLAFTVAALQARRLRGD
jgi:multiple sugar transport system permease protein